MNKIDFSNFVYNILCDELKDFNEYHDFEDQINVQYYSLIYNED